MAKPLWKLKDLRYIEKFSIAFFLLNIFQSIFCCIDKVLDFFFGYTLQHGTRDEREKAIEYENSAQVVNVLFRGAYSFVYNMQPENFLLRHVKYEHPRYVLQHDNIVLFGVTPTHAFFSVTTGADKDVRNPEIAPFVCLFSFAWAEQLVIIPLKHFHRLAAELGNPDDREVSILDMTGRCGSTLICQVMGKVPNVRTLSEPWPIVHAHGHYMAKRVTLSELEQITRSCIRLQCKPEHGEKINKIFLKLPCLIMHLQPMIQEMFPKFQFLFITRHNNAATESWNKFRHNLPAFSMKSRILIDFLLGHMSFPYGDKRWWTRREEWIEKLTPDMFVQGMALIYCGNLQSFLKNRKSYRHVILYEDFIADPAGETKKLFDVLGIGHKHVDAALKALKTDSQQGLFGSRGNMGLKVTKEAWEEMDDLMRECGIPLSSKTSLDELRQFLS